MTETPRFRAVDAIDPKEQQRLAAVAAGNEKLARQKRDAFAKGEQHGMELSVSLLKAASEAQEVIHSKEIERVARYHAAHEKARVRGARTFGVLVGVSAGAIAAALLTFALFDAAQQSSFNAATDASLKGATLNTLTRAAGEQP